MHLFIGWSGERSRFVAEGFAKWIQRVIQAVKPWMSTDMQRGANWIKQVAGQLGESRVGVFVLTPENLQAPWILFEAGALSKTLSVADSEHVCTLLVGLSARDVEMPLSQFMATSTTNDDVRKLVETINKAPKDAPPIVELDVGGYLLDSGCFHAPRRPSRFERTCMVSREYGTGPLSIAC